MICLRRNVILQVQVVANEKVISSSKGMLAVVTGNERALTLGTGHCAAFCKAANAGCSTTISFIATADGKINLAFP